MIRFSSDFIRGIDSTLKHLKIDTHVSKLLKSINRSETLTSLQLNHVNEGYDRRL